MTTRSPSPEPVRIGASARAALAAERTLLDAQNVFPVPDGDTGSNLLRTVDAVVAALAAGPPDPFAAAAEAAILGARGNSGAILAALLAGFDAGLDRDAPLDPASLRVALAAGAEAGYGAVAEPTEGTILTVARALADGAQGVDAAAALRAGLQAAEEALARTPDALPVLREAGVVDAGAAGLVALVRGALAAVEGNPLADTESASLPLPVHVADPSSRYRYCISFVVRASSLDSVALRALLGETGDSQVVVGDGRLARLHVHADDPDDVRRRFDAVGAVTDFGATDMRAQIQVRQAAAPTAEVALVYDSTADLPHPERDSWRMIPLTVAFGDEEFRDYVDLAVEDFYARLPETPVMPRTSQPSTGVFAALYDELLAQHPHVVSVHLSAAMSGTYESARRAAEGFPGRVTVIDSRMVSALLALAVVQVQAALDAGVPPERLPGVVEDLVRSSACVFSVPTLDYLQRNGRIGRAQAMVGSLLGFRPILAIEDGEVAPVRRVRGDAGVLPAMVEEIVGRSAPHGAVDIAIAHAADPGRAAELERLVRAARPGIRSVRTLTLGAVIGTHAGPGALGLAYAAPPAGGSGSPA